MSDIPGVPRDTRFQARVHALTPAQQVNVTKQQRLQRLLHPRRSKQVRLVRLKNDIYIAVLFGLIPCKRSEDSDLENAVFLSELPLETAQNRENFVSVHP